MADETNVPAQTEGAGQKAKARPEPVNLAMIEAAKRGIVLDPPRPATKAPEPTETSLPPAEEPPAVQEPAGEASEPAGEPSPETPVEPAPSEGNDAPAGVGEGLPDGEALAALSEASVRGRLSPSDEDRATRLMRELIKAGTPAPSLEAMAKLPWILGVRAAEQSWTTLDEASRATLLDGIVALGGDNAARLRLSLSRSLAKMDLPSGLKLASLTCAALWNSEKGALSAEHSKLIGNVFIGRGKPWVLQLPLESLTPEDAAPIASCAVFSAFNVNNPPITQLSILRYAAKLLGSLHENLLGLVAKGVSRWSGKWQGSLRKELPELPAPIATAMKAGDGRQQSQAEGQPAEEVELPLPTELEEKLKAATESGDAAAIEAATQEIAAWREANRPAPREKEGDEQAGEGGDQDEKRGRRQRGRDRDRNDRPEKKERPAYVPRDQAQQQQREPQQPREPRESRESREPRERERERERDSYREQDSPRGGNFNFPVAIKQIENYVKQLRNELDATQTKLRKAETRRPTADRVSLSVEEANLSPDELRRLVVQLESRNAELQGRIEELLADTELTTSIMASDSDAASQLRTLLALKLQDGYADFIALETGAPDVIVRQHYRGLLREIFAVLISQGLPLQGDLPPPPPAPMPPPPPPPADEIGEEEEDEDDIEPDPNDLPDEPAEAPIEEYQRPPEVDEEAPIDDEPPAEEGAPAEAEERPPTDEDAPDEPHAPEERPRE